MQKEIKTSLHDPLRGKKNEKTLRGSSFVPLMPDSLSSAEAHLKQPQIMTQSDVKDYWSD